VRNASERSGRRGRFGLAALVHILESMDRLVLFDIDMTLINSTARGRAIFAAIDDTYGVRGSSTATRSTPHRPGSSSTWPCAGARP